MRLKYFLGLVIYFILFSSVVYSQELAEKADTLTMQQFIKGCADYREKSIHSIKNVLFDFSMLVDSLAITSATPALHIAFRDSVMNVVLHGQIDDFKQALKKPIQEMAVKDPLAQIAYANWFEVNVFRLMDLHFLIANGILDSKPPYNLLPSPDLWKEFAFYDIKEEMTIVDVGAGTGIISFILGGMGIVLNIILTEIDDDFLKYLASRVDFYNNPDAPAALSVVKAGQHNLGLQNTKADRVILREVFHHLSDPDHILKDVHSVLKPGGYLILAESTKELNENNPNRCNKSTTYTKIINSLNKGGFQLVGKEIIGETYLLKFKAIQ